MESCNNHVSSIERRMMRGGKKRVVGCDKGSCGERSCWRKREDRIKEEIKYDEVLKKEEVVEHCGDLWRSTTLEEILWILAVEMYQVRRLVCKFFSSILRGGCS
jgi:hypothetical protein